MNEIIVCIIVIIAFIGFFAVPVYFVFNDWTYEPYNTINSDIPYLLYEYNGKDILITLNRNCLTLYFKTKRNKVDIFNSKIIPLSDKERLYFLSGDTEYCRQYIEKFLENMEKKKQKEIIRKNTFIKL